MWPRRAAAVHLTAFRFQSLLQRSSVFAGQHFANYQLKSCKRCSSHDGPPVGAVGHFLSRYDSLSELSRYSCARRAVGDSCDAPVAVTHTEENLEFEVEGNFVTTVGNKSRAFCDLAFQFNTPQAETGMMYEALFYISLHFL